MIEETARHAGHADLIRETIDGQQGRLAMPFLDRDGASIHYELFGTEA